MTESYVGALAARDENRKVIRLPVVESVVDSGEC
jgi:hypothetical protein